MGYTLNGQEVCNSNTCTSGLHDHKGTCNTTTDIIIAGIKSIQEKIKDLDVDTIAKEETLVQGIAQFVEALNNIDFTDLENSIAEVKNAVVNIDFSALAKEQTLLDKAEEIVTEVQKVNDAQEIIDQMVAIQLQTIIGDENIE